MRDKLCRALENADLRAAADLLAAGADINERDSSGESLLDDVIFSCEEEDRQQVVQFMLDHGADPTLRDHQGGGPLFSAVIAKDTGVLRLLLDHGADPNREHDLGDSLYSYAKFDYLYGEYDLALPEPPDDEAKSSEAAWLRYLDRLAVTYGKRRPDWLLLLRERGARTNEELRRYPFAA